MRLFTAIPLPGEIKDKVAGITRMRLPVAYVNTTNLHITMNFFGELDNDEVDKVTSLFVVFDPATAPFPISFEKVAKFRNQIHLTIHPNLELEKLHDVLEKYFRAQGFSFQDRVYYPHVKLANMHFDQVMNVERKLENFPNEELSALNFTADRVTLYESQLLLHHAKHTAIRELIL